MPKEIRKARQQRTSIVVSIPLKMVRGTDWELCEYVIVEHCIDGKIILRRLPGD